MTNTVAIGNNKWSTNHYSCTDYDSLCHVPKTVMEVNYLLSILLLVWLLAFTLHLMSPMSNVTDCRNLKAKKNKKNPLPKSFQSSLKPIRKCTDKKGSDCSKSVNWNSFPHKVNSMKKVWIFIPGMVGVLPNKSYGCVYQIFWSKALKGTKVLFCRHGSKLLLLLRVTPGFIPFSHINHLQLVVLREHKVVPKLIRSCSIPLITFWSMCYSQTNQWHQNIFSRKRQKYITLFENYSSNFYLHW